MRAHPQVDFIKELKIFTIQKWSDEKLIPALFSIGAKPYNNFILQDPYQVI